MNKKWLKIAGLFTVFGLAGMSGCSTDEVLSSEQLAKKNEISFRVSETRTGTSLKAGIANASTITNFTLSGITDAGNTLLDGVVVTRSSDGSAWDYAPKTVWPAADTKVDFYAYSPGNSRNVATPGFKGNQDHTVTYTVPTQHNGQEDFLVAVQEHTVTSGAQDPVQLNFKHALSRVLVNARATGSLTGAEVIVKSVVFKNLASTGTLTLKKDVLSNEGTPKKDISTGIPTNTDAFTYASYTADEIADYKNPLKPVYVLLWTADASTLTDYPIDMRGLNGIRISNDGNTYTALTGEMGALMVMPQQTYWNPEQNRFWVEISYSVNGTDYVSQKRVNDFWTHKEDDKSFCFEAGKAYEFNLIIGGSADGGPAGIVEVTVNDVNGWYTQPEGDDGIDVDRRYVVGDKGPNDKYVAEIDEHGQITKFFDKIELTYSVQDNNILVALLDKLIADYDSKIAILATNEDKEAYLATAFAGSNYKQKEYQILRDLLFEANPNATLLTKNAILASGFPPEKYYGLEGYVWSEVPMTLIWYHTTFSSWVSTPNRLEYWDQASGGWEFGSLNISQDNDLSVVIEETKTIGRTVHVLVTIPY
jgi:hypothetical protein